MPAITTVKIKPGTRPRMEYDQGNDIIARQMYSEKSNAAVCFQEKGSVNRPQLPYVGLIEAYLLPTTRAVFDCVLGLHLNLATDAFCSWGFVESSDIMKRATAALALNVEVLQFGLLLGLVRQLDAVVVPVMVPAGRVRRSIWNSHFLFWKADEPRLSELGGVESRVEDLQLHVMFLKKIIDRRLVGCKRIVFFFYVCSFFFLLWTDAPVRHLHSNDWILGMIGRLEGEAIKAGRIRANAGTQGSIPWTARNSQLGSKSGKKKRCKGRNRRERWNIVRRKKKKLEV